MPVPVGISLQQHYAATPERVFRAWTTPDELKRWWNPGADYACHKAEIDPRVGGTYFITMDCPNGSQRSVKGKYLEVDPPRRLVFTWLHEGHDMSKETIVSVTMDPAPGGGCLMTLKHEGFPDNNMAREHAQGWSRIVGSMEKALAEG